uniref:Uncharacterized protein n=1 Tax=Zea mays TaxID=4577 RepID=A0A804LNI1_MAIZE
MSPCTHSPPPHPPIPIYIISPLEDSRSGTGSLPPRHQEWYPPPWLWARRLRDLVPAGRLLSLVAGSLIVALTSTSLVLGDAGSASAFVVSTPRKLQADELAIVRLFQENTPSVVYITS